MSEKKNIDRLFQEKFKDHEVFPHPAVWDNIEKQITEKKRRRIVPLWLRIGSAAAVLLLLVSTGFWFFNEDSSPDAIPNEIIITDTEDNNETEGSISTDDTNTIVTKSTKKNQEQNLLANPIPKKSQIAPQNTGVVRNNQSQKGSTEELLNTTHEKAIAIEENVTTNNVEAAQSRIDNQINKIETISGSEKSVVALEETSTKDSEKKLDIQEEISKTDAEETKIADVKLKKWSIGSTISPIYYSTLSDGSPIDPSLANNTKDGNNSVSYGLKVSYKLSDKFSLQSGINSVELGYTTRNVTTLLSSSLLDGSNTNITTNIEGVSVSATSTVSQNSEAFSSRSSIDLSGSMDQTLSYIEIPMEAKYNIVQKKLGVNVIGGFSTYVLHQNRVSFTSFGKSTTLGEASNINSINFSGNLGLDFDYNLSKKLFINVSPMFKYQFNTFSENSGGFQPYYFGVYTGLNFRF